MRKYQVVVTQYIRGKRLFFHQFFKTYSLQKVEVEVVVMTLVHAFHVVSSWLDPNAAAFRWVDGWMCVDEGRKEYG